MEPIARHFSNHWKLRRPRLPVIGNTGTALPRRRSPCRCVWIADGHGATVPLVGESVTTCRLTVGGQLFADRFDPRINVEFIEIDLIQQCRDPPLLPAPLPGPMPGRCLKPCKMHSCSADNAGIRRDNYPQRTDQLPAVDASAARNRPVNCPRLMPPSYGSVPSRARRRDKTAGGRCALARRCTASVPQTMQQAERFLRGRFFSRGAWRHEV